MFSSAKEPVASTDTHDFTLGQGFDLGFENSHTLSVPEPIGLGEVELY